MLPPTSDPSHTTASSAASAASVVTSLVDAPSIASVLESTNPTVQAFFIQAALSQQATEAAAAAAATSLPASAPVSTPASTLTASPIAAVHALASTPALTPSIPVSATVNTALATAPASANTSATTPVTSTLAATTSAKSSSIASATLSSSSSSSSSSATRTFVSTKRFNPDDIFCLGCCRNLSVDHYTCPNTNRIFKSCNACRQKSRINSKKVTKPPTVPTKPTISMEEFGAKLKELEETQEESSLDVMVRLEGSVEMDQESLKTRGAQIAAQVYESTGYWFSHSRTNDETQSKTRLKIYGCSQREDRRAPPAPKTQSRKRNRPSTKAYFPCKGNLTMTFYHEMNHVRVVYGHKRHAKYDNRKCPDHVRAFVKENLGMAPRQLYDTLLENSPGLGITQAQVRYWSHYYKKNVDQDGSQNGSKGVSDNAAAVAAAAAAATAAAGASTSAGVADPSLIAQSIVNGTTSTSTASAGSSEQNDLQSQLISIQGSPAQQSQPTQEEQEQHERVQLLLASNAAALQSLTAQSHQVGTGLLGGSIAISVPMSESLSSSIVQRVLDGSNEELRHLQESLRAVSNVASLTDNGGDAVVQQVRAFMKENDQQQLQLLEQRQLLEHQQQQQQLQQEHRQEQQQPELMLETKQE